MKSAKKIAHENLTSMDGYLSFVINSISAFHSVNVWYALNIAANKDMSIIIVGTF
tara:strand:+ start:764 stop:928 length:165 start_codon:yes stop_codon:yes gene_type:complete